MRMMKFRPYEPYTGHGLPLYHYAYGKAGVWHYRMATAVHVYALVKWRWRFDFLHKNIHGWVVVCATV
jgi:hypothetical protein